MKHYEYGFICAGLPALVTSLVPFMTIGIMSICCADKATSLIRWIVTNAFSSFITKKNDNGLTRWLFRDIDLTTSEELLGKVLVSLFGLYFLLFTLASSLFWSTLLLDITYSCKPNDPSIECFEYDLKENVKFWKVFSRLNDDPIDCNSAKFQNGSAGVICYQIVFNIGAACGASYGGFKLALIFVNAATSLMLLHQGSRSIKRTRIIIGLLLIAIYAAFLVFEFVEIEKGSAIVNLNSQGLALYLQLLMGLVAGFTFVFFIPWKELVAFRSHFRLYEPIV